MQPYRREELCSVSGIPYSSYLVRIGDNRNHFHLMTALWADQRIDFVNLLYEPRRSSAVKPCLIQPLCQDWRHVWNTARCDEQ